MAIDAVQAIVKASGQTLAARWWQWAASAPADQSPVMDSTGAFAGLNQPGDVWFLAGTYGGRAERHCTIPAGQPLFFPVFNTQRAVGLFGKPMRIIPETAEATLDGTRLEVHEFTSGRFKLAGKTRIAWGLWCVVEPPSPGNHVVTFRSKIPEGFWVEVTYQLVVA